MMIPGRALHRIAARICCPSTLERVVEPAIADLQKEYAEAALTGNVKRAWALMRGYLAIAKAIAMCVLNPPIQTDDDRRSMVLTMAWSVTFVVASTTLLILPPLYNTDVVTSSYVVLTLVPQAVPLAIPIGIAFGIAIGASGRMALRASTALLIGATAASMLSFAVLAWGMPAANQAFREIAFRQVRARGNEGPITLQKGANEMTFSELSREIAVLSAGQSRQARQLAFSFHLRFSLAVATLAVASVLLAVRARRRWLRVTLAVTTCLVYWMLLYAGDAASLRGYLPVAVGAWLPNVLLIALAMLIASSSSSRLRGSVVEPSH